MYVSWKLKRWIISVNLKFQPVHHTVNKPLHAGLKPTSLRQASHRTEQTILIPKVLITIK